MTPYTQCRRCGLNEFINPRPLNCPNCNAVIHEEAHMREMLARKSASYVAPENAKQQIARAVSNTIRAAIKK